MDPPPSATPQGGFATPRTPRSPQRSPQRDRAPPADPRRRPTLTTTTSSGRPAAVGVAAPSPSDEAVQIAVSRESRTLSSGVPVPVSLAGPRGASSSKRNPFSFPQYTSAEKMDVVSELPGDSSREVNMAEVEDSSRVGSRAASRAASPAPTPHSHRRATQYDTRRVEALYSHPPKAVSLSHNLNRLNELRERQRAMQRSAQYRSASMTVVHAQIDKVRSENDSKLRRAQKKFEDPEVENMRQWVVEIQTWMDSVRPTVEQQRDTTRDREGEGGSGRRCTRRGGGEGEGAGGGSVEQRLGISLHPPKAHESSQGTVEEGEVHPSPPKTLAELAKECTELERQLAECNKRLARVLQQMAAEKARNLTKDLELAADQAQMQIKLNELVSQQRDMSKTIQDHRQELKALHQKLQEHKQREPPPLPPAVTFDELTAHILPILRPELRNALHEGLGAVRRGVDEALSKQQQDICEQVFMALQLVFRLISSVKNMSDHQPEILKLPPPPPMQSVQHS
ncbi:hypothetical protein OH77DRAFT_1525918 [Trametes cingulata]|nr:hypothetical protein OH77DRAFT_1525918 [Trametes cingulata]